MVQQNMLGAAHLIGNGIYMSWLFILYMSYFSPKLVQKWSRNTNKIQSVTLNMSMFNLHSEQTNRLKLMETQTLYPGASQDVT